MPLTLTLGSDLEADLEAGNDEAKDEAALRALRSTSERAENGLV